MRYAICILLPAVLLTGCIGKELERAYYEGQRDAINGDIRIKRNIDSCYIWVKSPWDDGSEPNYNPSYNCD